MEKKLLYQMYVTPVVEVHRVALESSIASVSVTTSDWEDGGPVIGGSVNGDEGGDVYLSF